MAAQLFTNARIVSPTEDFMGSVEVENGIITAVEKGKTYQAGVDLKGEWLIPGCIDIHTDYLEKELYPRPSAAFPLPFALHFSDARAAACGITTVFSAVSFSDNEGKNRSFTDAIALCRQIDAVRSQMLVRHYLHARIDPNSDTILSYLDDMAKLESLYLVVYNDHIPGTRQYTIEQQVEMRMKSMNLTEAEARRLLLDKVEALSHINHRAAIQKAFEHRCILGSHDDTTVDHVIEGKAYGATLSEMPTTLEAARKAKAEGMWVCLGAPNYYRGGSHCGNLSSLDAIDEDLVDIFCSDYHFPTMLGAVVKMMENGISPSRAISMVSLNPARLLKFDKELGSIEVGKTADIVTFSSKQQVAVVSMAMVGGVIKYSADYNHQVKALAAESNPQPFAAELI